MIVYIKSDESNLLFPENKPWHFKIHLKTPLIFHGKWTVSLLEFQASANKSRTLYSQNQTLFIYSNICGESIVNGEKKTLLRRVVQTKSRKWDVIYDAPIYLPMSEKEIYEFEIYLKDVQGRSASFLQDPLLITLHFKPQ